MNLDNANYAIPVLQQEPENKHKVLRALLSILLFVIISGLLVVYQINKEPVISTETVVPAKVVVQKNTVSAEELRWLADALKKDSVNKSPPTAKELTAMANALNKDAKSQKQLSAEELQDLAKNLNQK